MKSLLRASIILLIVNNLYMRYIIKILNNMHPGDEFWFALITGLNIAYGLVVLSCISASKKKRK